MDSTSTGVTGCSREKYWDELTTDEKVEKLAGAVELLARWFVEIEKTSCLLNQHQHLGDGRIFIPMQHNQVEQPWYKSHLLNRRPPNER